jgi:hypothetical protein
MQQGLFLTSQFSIPGGVLMNIHPIMLIAGMFTMDQGIYTSR